MLVGVTSGALGPEHAVSDPVYGNRAATDLDPEVACGSVSCLAVWWSGGGNDSIRAARIGADGTVDGAGFTLGAGPGARYPAVAAAASAFLVVWMEQSNQIFGTRVAEDGRVLGGRFPIATGPPAWDPAVGSDGTSFFVAWNENSDVAGVRVGGDGSVGSAQPLSQATGLQYAVAVAGGASGFLVTWQDGRAGSSPDVYARRLSEAGVVNGDEFPIAIASHAEQLPSVATDGANYLILWEDDLPGRDTRADVWGRLVPETGPLGEARAIAVGHARQGEPSVAWNGHRYLAAWSDTRSSTTWTDVYAARITSEANPEGDAIVVSNAAIDQHQPSVAALDDRFVVGWEDRRFYDSPSPDVYAARLANDGKKLDPDGFLVSKEANDQSDPAVVWNGAGTFVTWQEFALDKSKSSIVGARLTHDGGRLDGTGIQISTPVDAQQGLPAVAWNGSDYLVVWTDPRSYAASGADIFGALVGADGTRKVEFPISTAEHGQSSPAVVWNGTNFLVVWQDSRRGPIGDDLRRSGSEIFGARVSPTGHVLDPDGRALVETPDRDFAAQVAWNGTTHLLVWSRLPGPPETDVPFQVVGRLIGVDASAVGGEIPIAAGSGDHRWPQVASDGSGFLVTWMEGFGGVPIRAARVDGGGAVLDPAGFDVGAGGWYPSLAWSGAEYVVGWLGRNGSEFAWRARRASRDGRAVGDTFDISGSVSPSFHNLSTGPAGDVVAAYTRRDDSVASGGATRVFLRPISPDPAAQQPSPPAGPQPPPARPPPQVRCAVPRLRGLTTLRARRLLAAKRCRLGRVRRAYSRAVRRGRIISQSRRPGARLPRGTRVNVVVSRGRRRH